jgi:hypothetical protein
MISKCSEEKLMPNKAPKKPDVNRPTPISYPSFLISAVGIEEILLRDSNNTIASLKTIGHTAMDISQYRTIVLITIHLLYEKLGRIIPTGEMIPQWAD